MSRLFNKGKKNPKKGDESEKQPADEIETSLIDDENTMPTAGFFSGIFSKGKKNSKKEDESEEQPADEMEISLIDDENTTPTAGFFSGIKETAGSWSSSVGEKFSSTKTSLSLFSKKIGNTYSEYATEQNTVSFALANLPTLIKWIDRLTILPLPKNKILIPLAVILHSFEAWLSTQYHPDGTRKNEKLEAIPSDLKNALTDKAVPLLDKAIPLLEQNSGKLPRNLKLLITLLKFIKKINSK